jgi:hypothetical protein
MGRVTALLCHTGQKNGLFDLNSQILSVQGLESAHGKIKPLTFGPRILAAALVLGTEPH